MVGGACTVEHSVDGRVPCPLVCALPLDSFSGASDGYKSSLLPASAAFVMLSRKAAPGVHRHCHGGFPGSGVSRARASSPSALRPPPPAPPPPPPSGRSPPWRRCPAFKLLTYYGSVKERAAKRQGWSKPNAFHVCITSYTLVLQASPATRSLSGSLKSCHSALPAPLGGLFMADARCSVGDWTVAASSAIRHISR